MAIISRPLGRSMPRAVSNRRRGAFGESLWAKRRLSARESLQIGARLNHGRSYARSGQALSIDLEKGIIRAKGQDSRPRPYDVNED
jgi:uncharacterized Zn finger protein